MKVEKLLKMIPATQLSFLSVETKVDYQVKKLSGIVIFKLILFSMLNSEKLSLRVMESFLMSAQFKTFLGDSEINSKYNSIRDRITNINSEYFEKVFNLIFKKHNQYLNEEKSLTRVDSTFISISSKLINWGMKNGPNSSDINFLKFTLSMKGNLPSAIQFYSHQDFVNENIALPDAIFKNKHLNESVVVFDRGLQTRKVFNKFSDDDILFVGRIKGDFQFKLKKKFPTIKSKNKDGVELLEDSEVYLYSEGKITSNTFRICKYNIKKSQNTLWLVSNLFDADAYEIATLYRQRWDIEVFFKFLKQHLNFKHIVSRNENGIKVMMYMTLILSILIMAYKKTNSIKGFKIAKLKFEIELDNSILKEIVKICGGNPNKAKHLWNTG